jgi:hypothetical protein
LNNACLILLNNPFGATMRTAIAGRISNPLPVPDASMVAVHTAELSVSVQGFEQDLPSGQGNVGTFQSHSRG